MVALLLIPNYDVIVDMPVHKLDIMVNWLHDEIRYGNWNISFHLPRNYKINFKHEEDKVKFILRWI